MAVQYIGNKYIDLGEKIHIRAIVNAVCEEEIPFVIRSARYELIDPNGVIEDSGDCVIQDHVIDSLIEPQTIGKYELKLIYEVGDEIWVEPIRLRVS